MKTEHYETNVSPELEALCEAIEKEIENNETR